MEFTPFPKLSRWSRDIVVTEKIDGTNACICIEDLEGAYADGDKSIIYVDGGLAMRAGSRTRWITPEDDNHGFARWAHEHKDDLMLLGPGQHFGEWWGKGVQRNYAQPVRRFSLFNSVRWADAATRPACCEVVPVLYQGPMFPGVMEKYIRQIEQTGSMAAPGFMDPEGVVLYHTAAGIAFKKTVKKDESPKGIAA